MLAATILWSTISFVTSTLWFVCFSFSLVAGCASGSGSTTAKVRLHTRGLQGLQDRKAQLLQQLRVNVVIVLPVWLISKMQLVKKQELNNREEADGDAGVTVVPCAVTRKCHPKKNYLRCTLLRLIHPSLQ